VVFDLISAHLQKQNLDSLNLIEIGSSRNPCAART
jgi:hypothetical protein